MIQQISHFLSAVKSRLGTLVNPRRWRQNDWQERQNQCMRHCFKAHGVRLKGVIHVGAHFGEEYLIYKEAGAQEIVFFEPMPHIFDELERRFSKYKDVTLVKKALGARRAIQEMYVHRLSGESSSFLTPSALYDGFFDGARLPLEIETLDNVRESFGRASEFNLLVTDTQGFDLEVLRGAEQTLKAIDYIYTEVSEGHYKGEPTVAELDDFLVPLGFTRKELQMYGSWKGTDRWGDLFYAKNKG